MVEIGFIEEDEEVDEEDIQDNEAEEKDEAFTVKAEIPSNPLHSM